MDRHKTPRIFASGSLSGSEKLKKKKKEKDRRTNELIQKCKAIHGFFKSTSTAVEKESVHEVNYNFFKLSKIYKMIG